MPYPVKIIHIKKWLQQYLSSWPYLCNKAPPWHHDSVTVWHDYWPDHCYQVADAHQCYKFSITDNISQRTKYWVNTVNRCPLCRTVNLNYLIIYWSSHNSKICLTLIFRWRQAWRQDPRFWGAFIFLRGGQTLKWNRGVQSMLAQPQLCPPSATRPG